MKKENSQNPRLGRLMDFAEKNPCNPCNQHKSVILTTADILNAILELI